MGGRGYAAAIAGVYRTDDLESPRTCFADVPCGLALRTCFADLLCGLGRPEVLPKLTSALVWPQFYLSVYLQIDFRWYNITALALFPLAIVSLLLSLTFT